MSSCSLECRRNSGANNPHKNTHSDMPLMVKFEGDKKRIYFSLIAVDLLQVNCFSKLNKNYQKLLYFFPHQFV